MELTLTHAQFVALQATNAALVAYRVSGGNVIDAIADNRIMNGETHYIFNPVVPLATFLASCLNSIQVAALRPGIPWSVYVPTGILAGSVIRSTPGHLKQAILTDTANNGGKTFTLRNGLTIAAPIIAQLKVPKSDPTGSVSIPCDIEFSALFVSADNTTISATFIGED